MYVVENLEQDAEYTIRVAAITPSGSGNHLTVLFATEFLSICI